MSEDHSLATEFLTGSVSKDLYRRVIAQAVETVASSLPVQAYSGASPAALAHMVDTDFVDPNFLSQHGKSFEQVAYLLRTVVQNSVSVTDPSTAAHLHCPPLIAALAAEVVISALNQSMDSFDQAPIATVIEQKMIRWLGQEVGLPPTADGTFTTGGSQSNYMGLLLARDAFLQKQWNWSAQKSGLPPEARRLRILCSEVAHFTIEKSAMQLGLGTDSVVHVGADEHFRMSLTSLRNALDDLRKQDLLPIAIVATAGTTDFGSIDPMSEIAALAQSAGAWFHVDAAYGGALLFSTQHRAKLTGIEQADSLGIDFHKLFWQPIPCSAFLLRDACYFDSIRLHADYLNPELHEEKGIPNLVTTSLLTSRRFDALKLWISFQTVGRSKLARMIDRTVELAAQAAAFIKNEPRLELVCEPQLSTVVFRYVPQKPGHDADQINFAIRQRLFDRGEAIIGHTRVRGCPCLKFTWMNPAVTELETHELVRKILQTGLELESARPTRGT